MSEQQLQSALNEALIYLHRGAPKQAVQFLSKLVKQSPHSSQAHFLMGIAYSMLDNKTAAIESYDKAVLLSPCFVEALINRAADLYSIGAYERSVSSSKEALGCDPNNSMAWLNLGNAQQALEQYTDALASYEKALALNPHYAQAWNNAGDVLATLGRLEESLNFTLKAIEIQPVYSDAYSHLGLTYAALHRYEQALSAYVKALQINPENSECYINLASLHSRLGQDENALTSYMKALQLNPNSANVHNNLGSFYYERKQYAEAIDRYAHALALNPKLQWLPGTILHTRMKVCDWNFYERSVNQLRPLLNAKKTVAAPFTLLGLPYDLSQLKESAQTYTQATYRVRPSVLKPPSGQSQKIKIVYLSADYHNHATTYLMAELFEQHDRSRFEVIGICYGRSPEDEMRQRIAKSFDQFIEAGNLSDREIAQIIQDQQIDIAIDLKGHTQDSRLGIFSYRPAPIQLHYLGYPGSLGADFIDYLIADPVLIPANQQEYYTEKIVYLPDSYQVNDRARKIATVADAKTDHGLPEQAFVFCCFNNNWKITPDLFDIWMRLLERIEGSVLWLFKENQTAADNLQKEAEVRGIAPNRLVFAEKLPLDQHLARHRHADLFLDTFYYNAHTTASDALWSGLPVLTKQGNTFASRVAASLLNAINLPELITHSADDYEALAVELVMNPAKLNAIKQRLADNRLAAPLFDTPRFTKHLESAYEQMVARRRQGLAPAHIFVPAMA